MAIKRYWRLTGFCTQDNGPLELSEARVYEADTLADASATLSATTPPLSGDLSDLRDGLSTVVVSWAYASYSQPGFALVWDFGVGGGVDVACIQLGSGGSIGTYPLDLVVQSSTNGVNWITYETVVAVQYPGPLAMSTAPSVTEDGDNNFNKVSLLLHCEGVDGSTVITDSSNSPKTITTTGNARLRTANSKFGASACYFDGSGDYLSLPNRSAFTFGADDFTIEMWFYQEATGAIKQLIGCHSTSGGNSVAAFLMLSNASKLDFAIFSGGSMLSVTNPSTHTLNAWHHVAAVRIDTALKLFVDGVLVATTVIGSVTVNAGSYGLALGAIMSTGTPDPGGYYYQGYIDDVRVTKGVGRYSSSFTPPASAFPNTSGLVVIPFVFPAPHRADTIGYLPDVYTAPGAQPTVVQGHLREHTFFDAHNGGVGNVVGTVKEKNTPTNTPLHRRVLLVDEASRITIRETWSDPITGAFEFRGVKQGVKYSTISYDHLHNYRAVIADNQDAA